MKITQETIGFDLGNTIVTKVEGIRCAFPDALRVIERLLRERFGLNSYIVSKVSPEQEVRAKAWLEKNEFCKRTGLPEENVLFCRERADKAPICKERLITHFVDDRPQVLSHMDSVPHRFLFSGIEEDFEKYKESLSGVIKVNSWIELERILLP